MNRDVKSYPELMTTTLGTRAPHITAVTATGVGLVLVALVLYSTELSRATAVATLPLALCLFGAAFFARERGHWPSRPWLVIFGVMVFAALSSGLWLYIYGQLHRGSTA